MFCSVRRSFADSLNNCGLSLNGLKHCPEHPHFDETIHLNFFKSAESGWKDLTPFRLNRGGRRRGILGAPG